MNIEQLDKQKMDAMELLASTNVEIGAAKGILLELQATNTTYLATRESEALAKIQAILDNSEDLVNQIHANHDQVLQFHNTVATMVTFLREIQGQVLDAVDAFGKNVDFWNKTVEQQQEELARIRQEQKVMQITLEADKEMVAQGMKEIEKGKALIESRQAQITVALQVLEEKKHAKH